MVRFWWADANDVFLVKRRLAKVLDTQCKDWEVVRWDETFFKKKEEAWPALLQEIGIPTIFGPGKIVLTYGIPSCHARLSDELKNIPDGIVLIMVAKLDRTLKLLQRAKDLGPKGKVDDPLSLTRSNAVGWMQQRAKDIGATIDDLACRMLADKVGFDANMLTSEMSKLMLMSEAITPAIVQEAAYGDGESDFFEMMNLAMAGNMLAAHEKLRRLVAISGPEGLSGMWMDWARRMAIAEGLGRDAGAAGELLGVRKRDKGFGREHLMSASEFDYGAPPKKAPVPMFKDTKGIWRSCQDIAGKPDDWGYDSLLWLYRAILGIRKRNLKGYDGTRVLEQLLEAISNKKG